MALNQLLLQSSELFQPLGAVLALPLAPSSSTSGLSRACSSLSLLHWEASHALFEQSFLPSAMVLHRAQFEAAVRAVWVFYAANPTEVAKLSATLSAEAEQNAKNMAQVKSMLDTLAKVPAAQAPYQSLSRFKEASWSALTSFAHAGIHAVQRHASGYPETLVEDIVRNSNAIAVLV